MQSIAQYNLFTIFIIILQTNQFLIFQNQQKLIFKIFLYIVSEICNDGSQRPDYFINLKIYLQFFQSISISGPLLLLL